MPEGHLIKIPVKLKKVFGIVISYPVVEQKK